MELILALAIGVLAASGVYLVLRPRTFQVIIGLSLASYAVNLFILAMGRLRMDAAPILSGANADGMRGMEIIHRQGGFCVAQDPLTAQVAFMPSKAIAKEVVHQIASPDEIAAIMNLCQPSSLS